MGGNTKWLVHLMNYLKEPYELPSNKCKCKCLYIRENHLGFPTWSVCFDVWYRFLYTLYCSFPIGEYITEVFQF